MLPSNPNVIRANPLLETYKALLVLLFIVLGLYLGIFVLMIVFDIILSPASARLSRFLAHGSSYMLLIPTYMFLFILFFAQWRYWKRIEQRRFAAAGRDRSLLAIEQPTAHPAALPLPYTIKLRMSKEGILLFMGMALVFALLSSAVFAWLNDGFLFISPDRLHNFLVLFVITAALMVILPLAIFLSPLGDQKVEVTEQGLSVRYGGQKGAVRWEEARLFAMYNTWGAQKSGASITYELSSATAIARWNWIQRSKRISIIMSPVVPREEYNQQMQSLTALIVARTGLPLADLRTEPVD